MNLEDGGFLSSHFCKENKYPMKLSTFFNKYAMPVSLFSLTAALVFFTLELASIRRTLPGIVEGVKYISDGIEPVLEEIAAIREEMPAVLAGVNNVSSQIPAILTEVDDLSDQIPMILDQVDMILEEIPPILAESEKIRMQVPGLLEESRAYRSIAVVALAESENYRMLLPDILSETASIRMVVPDLLGEAEAYRLMIPEYIDDVEKIVDDLARVGQEASEGAVKGVFTGIVKAPGALFGGMIRTIVPPGKFTELDIEPIVAAAIIVLESDDPEAYEEFKIAESGVSGSIRFVRAFKQDGRLYKELDIKISKNGEFDEEILAIAYLDEDGAWQTLSHEKQ